MSKGTTSHRKTGQMVCLTITALCLAAAAAMLVLGLFTGGKTSEQAMKDGQEVSFSFLDGKIEGAMRSSTVVVTAPPPAELPPSNDEPEPEPTPEPEAEPVVTEPEEPLHPAARIKPRDVPEVTTSPVEPLTPENPETTPEQTPEMVPEVKRPPVSEINPIKEPTRTANSLAPANPDLIEKTPTGEELPTISAKNGTKPSEYYAKPFEMEEKGPLVSIVVTGLGHSRASTEAAIKLPSEVTLAFSPYAKETNLLARNARALGHEVMVDLPMETADYPASDPGPYALLTILSPNDNLKRLHWVLSRFGAFTGVLTPANEKLSGNDGFFRPISDELKKRGLLLLVGNHGNIAPGKESDGVLKAQMLIDETLSADAIKKQLKLLETAAKKQGYAIGISQAYPMSLSLINEWADSLKKNGVTLAPLSALAK